MRVMSFARRYLLPFLSDASAAGACVANSELAFVALALTAAGLWYASLPAGNRMIKRLVRVPS